MTKALRVLHVISGDLWAGAEVQAYTLMFHLSRMPDTEVAALVMNEGTLASKLRASGIIVYIASERDCGTLDIFMRLRRVITTWEPHVIHSHREKENIFAVLASRSSRKIPVVRTLHGGVEHGGFFGWKAFRRSMVMRLNRWCVLAARQHVIAVSGALARQVSDDFPGERIIVIENGVDAEAVLAQSSSAGFRVEQPQATHVGLAGRLVPVKRVDLFLETAALLRVTKPDRRWQFHIFGDGPERANLEGLARRFGIADVVQFHGHSPDLASAIRDLDALVICSDHEGMPMIALEAAALSVPTIGHSVGGLVDVVPREFLVTRHDAQGYSEAILRVIQKDSRTIVEHYAAEVVRRLSAKRNAEQVRALYAQVIAQGMDDREFECR